MSKSAYGILFVALIVLGIVAVVNGYWQTIYAIDRANGWIGRVTTTKSGSHTMYAAKEAEP